MVQWIKNLFNKALRAFKEFIKLAFPILLQTFIGLLKDFAIKVVQDLETTNLSNNERRQMAFTQISKEAKRRGIEFTASAVFLLIEMALQSIKSKEK